MTDQLLSDLRALATEAGNVRATAASATAAAPKARFVNIVIVHSSNCSLLSLSLAFRAAS